ncbi:MAG: class I SAM-dependent methyltransferase [Polyangiaceae bacterium]
MTTNAPAKFWNDVAGKYAAKPVADVPAFERKKAITRKHLTPSATILELGCGTGSLALEMSRHAGHIHAMDISSEMIRIANDKKAAQGVTNVTFYQQVLDEGVPFEPEQFDGAWAYSILHLVENRRGTLERIFSLLKPGGSFISSNVCLGGTWVPYGALIAVMRWFGKAPMVYLYDGETILRELREVGFGDMTVHAVGADAKVAFVTATKP